MPQKDKMAKERRWMTQRSISKDSIYSFASHIVLFSPSCVYSALFLVVLVAASVFGSFERLITAQPLILHQYYT